MNPSDQEGEVDHSFFDSDCDETTGGRTNQLAAESTSAEEKDSDQLKEDDRSLASSVSSITCASTEVNSNCSDNEDDTNPTSSRPTEAKEEDQNDESKEEGSSPAVRSPSFTSTETSVDADRMESADSQAVQENQTEDTVTGVSNAERSLAFNNAEAGGGNLKEQQKESVPSSGPSKVQDKDRSDAREFE